jgi:predicted metal-dependent peptidase
MNELYHINKTGTDITVVQCDAAISDISPFNIKKDIQIKGRRGTDFQPVIDYYNENVHKYTCLIYFTDGECSAPTPARGRMLWVLSSQSQLNPDLIGPQIKLN